MIATAKRLLNPPRRWKSHSNQIGVTQHDRTDRKSTATRKRELIQREDWITEILVDAKSLADKIASSDAGSLGQHTNQLRHFRLSGTPLADRQLLTLAAAAVVRAVNETLGLTLFDMQIRAGLIVSLGAVAEMQTGEGKTLSGILPAYLHSLTGRGVHVATTNEYLAGRDFEKLSPVFDSLGVRAGILRSDATLEESQSSYAADVTFGTGHAFGFDYLRDQVTRGQAHSQRVGAITLSRVSDLSQHSRLRQRGLHCAIVDEIDHVLIDDAVSPLVLSHAESGEAADAEIHQAAKRLASLLRQNHDFNLDAGRRNIALTDAGFDLVYGDGDTAIHEQLLRPWHEYVVLALTARHIMQRDTQYVIRDDEVQIVDASTGRIFADRSWSEGLHQAVQAAEGVTIRPESQPIAKITRQRFYRYYKNLGGMTGTATDCQQEFASVYGLPIAVVPTRKPSRRIVHNDVITSAESDKFRAIARDAREIHQTGRPVLIGTLDIAQSIRIAEELRACGLAFDLLNGMQDADEATIIAKAGHAGAITLATNMAGRGTDIQLDEQSDRLGGLHVIVAERHPLARVDRQLVGRCARCGDPGSAVAYLSPDDTLASKIAPWVGKSMRRKLDSTRTVEPTAGTSTAGTSTAAKLHSSSFANAQQTQQKTETAKRMQLLQFDLDQETMRHHSTTSTSTSGRCQL
jgi:preprotein translocase subunit SecA